MTSTNRTVSLVKRAARGVEHCTDVEHLAGSPLSTEAWREATARGKATARNYRALRSRKGAVSLVKADANATHRTDRAQYMREVHATGTIVPRYNALRDHFSVGRRTAASIAIENGRSGHNALRLSLVKAPRVSMVKTYADDAHRTDRELAERAIDRAALTSYGADAVAMDRAEGSYAATAVIFDLQRRARPVAPRHRDLYTLRSALRPAAAFLVAALALALGSLSGTPSAQANPSTARPVSLSDAKYAPTATRTLEPGKRVRLTCAGYRPSDLGAYRENGDALSAQVIAPTASYWHDTHEGSRVKWTKSTRQFFNGTERKVTVAIWCE